MTKYIPLKIKQKRDEIIYNKLKEKIRYKLVNSKYESVLAKDAYCIQYSNVPGTIVTADPDTYGIMTFRSIHDLFVFFQSISVPLRRKAVKVLKVKPLTEPTQTYCWNSSFSEKAIYDFYKDIKTGFYQNYTDVNDWNTVCYHKIKIVEEMFNIL